MPPAASFRWTASASPTEPPSRCATSGSGCSCSRMRRQRPRSAMAAATVDEYIAGFPLEVAERLQRIREVIVSAVAAVSDAEPEERIRYGIAAVMLGARYALHFAGWKKHIGLYPVPSLEPALE